MRVSASIVVYKEKIDVLKKSIESFLNLNFEKELIVIDNSPSLSLEKFCSGFSNLKYIHSGVNLGFGRGHNLGFKSLIKSSDIHIIINPDIYFDKQEVENMIKWFVDEKNLSLAVPSVYYPDGKPQFIVRKIPTPITLLKRRLNFNGIFDDFIKEDELERKIPLKVSQIPFAHGCFLIFKSDIFKKLNGFDERFFMYMEDIDIFIRAKKWGSTVWNPDFKVFHEYRKGSSKNIKLLIWHIISAIKFFFKYKTCSFIENTK